MNSFSSDYAERWQKRILKSRRRYFFEHLRNTDGRRAFSVSQTLIWIRSDVIYLGKWGLNILLQMRAFGLFIREKYDVSLFQQWMRMAYLAFVLKVDPKNFRTCQLYESEKWNRVNNYVYDQYKVQYHLVDLSSPDEKEIIRNKFRFYEYCRSYDFYTPRVLSVFVNGKNTLALNGKAKFPRKDIFIKDLYGKAGQGVKKFTYNEDHYTDKKGNRYFTKDLEAYLAEYSNKTPVLIQNVMKNHDSWKPFTTGGLATCRIVTAKCPESSSIIPLFAAFRMPVRQMVADNFSIGGIVASVDLKTGELGTAIRSKPMNGSFYFDVHPDTHQQIKGLKLPQWNELLDFTLKLHSKFATIFVGWDVCLSEEGCCVIEGNLGWGADSFEVSHQLSINQTIYPKLFEQWMDVYSTSNE